jgi:hypothetical protein
MLSTTTVRNTLRTVFPTKVVNETLDAMRSMGMINGGVVAQMTPHGACVATIACSLYEGNAPRALQRAMVVRDWRVQARLPGHRAAPYPFFGLTDLRLVGTMIAPILAGEPGIWEISAIEAVGAGLIFNRGDYSGRVPDRIPREWQKIPPHVLTEFARHHEPSENQRNWGRLTLDRIARTLRPLPTPSHKFEAAE